MNFNNGYGASGLIVLMIIVVSLSWIAAKILDYL